MATSGNLAAGQAATNRPGGTGKGTRGRAAGLVAAALGLARLIGLGLGLARREARPAAAPAGGNAGVVSVDPGYQFTYHDEDPWLFAAPGPVIDFGPLECGAAPCVSAPAPS